MTWWIMGTKDIKNLKYRFLPTRVAKLELEPWIELSLSLEALSPAIAR